MDESASPSSLPEHLLAIATLCTDVASLRETPKDIARNIKGRRGISSAPLTWLFVQDWRTF